MRTATFCALPAHTTFLRTLCDRQISQHLCIDSVCILYRRLYISLVLPVASLLQLDLQRLDLALFPACFLSSNWSTRLLTCHLRAQRTCCQTCWPSAKLPKRCDWLNAICVWSWGIGTGGSSALLPNKTYHVSRSRSEGLRRRM